MLAHLFQCFNFILSPDDATASPADETVVAAPSPKKKLPPGVEDFDAENANDPFQVSDYAMDIFDYLKDREVSSRFEFGCWYLTSLVYLYIVSRFLTCSQSTRLRTTWRGKCA